MRIPDDQTELHSKLERKLRDALYSESPGAMEGLRVRAYGDVEAQQVRYFFYVDVLQELVKAARYRREAATAVLLGRFCLDDEGAFIEVEAFRGLEYLYGADPVERTRPIVEEAFEAVEGGDDGRHVVGVFCARPGGDAQLDVDTARLHLSLFNLPYQLAMVIDGDHHRLGLYARRRNRAFFNAAFYVVEERVGQEERDRTHGPVGDESMNDDEMELATFDGDDQ